ncbi:MAG: hypothetical protein R2705_09535 [Ilumatobacteraceae bacterium]
MTAEPTDESGASAEGQAHSGADRDADRLGQVVKTERRLDGLAQAGADRLLVADQPALKGPGDEGVPGGDHQLVGLHRDAQPERLEDVALVKPRVPEGVGQHQRNRHVSHRGFAPGFPHRHLETVHRREERGRAVLELRPDHLGVGAAHRCDVGLRRGRRVEVDEERAGRTGLRRTQRRHPEQVGADHVADHIGHIPRVAPGRRRPLGRGQVAKALDKSLPVPTPRSDHVLGVHRNLDGWVVAQVLTEWAGAHRDPRVRRRSHATGWTPMPDRPERRPTRSEGGRSPGSRIVARSRPIRRTVRP